MSAIAVLYERDGAPVGEARILRMLDRLRSRGPDRSAHAVCGSVALAQAALETTSEDAFDRQPMRARSGDLWIVADARLDNRRELLAAGAPGRDPSKTSDAELILLAYERWGEACATRLLGDFAFAIWDGERRRLFFARDHLGVRCLYYHDDGHSFRAATEMHALFADERVSRRPDPAQMALFLTYSYAERDETLYHAVRALPPAHSMTVDAHTIRVGPYWRPDPWRTLPPASDEDYAAQFFELFRDAVRCRLRANTRVASDVSGGLDSSSVACEAAYLSRAGEMYGEPPILLHAAFPGLDCDEHAYSQAIADHLGLPMETCIPEEVPGICRLEQDYPDLYFHPTQTVVDPAVDAARARGARVFLTGFGGDLAMRLTGYEGAHFLREGRLEDALAATELDANPFSLARWRELARQTLWAVAPRAVPLIRRMSCRPGASWPWLSHTSAEVVQSYGEAREAALGERHPDVLKSLMSWYVTHSAGTHFPAVLQDRAAAQRRIEFRHPLYDLRLVELQLALPHEQRATRRQAKGVLRRAMGTRLPSLVRDRCDKAEFTSYIVRVFVEGQRRALVRLFTRPLLDDYGVIDARVVREMVDASPAADVASALVALASLELWLRAPDDSMLATHPPPSYEARHEHA